VTARIGGWTACYRLGVPRPPRVEAGDTGSKPVLRLCADKTTQQIVTLRRVVANDGEHYKAEESYKFIEQLALLVCHEAVKRATVYAGFTFLCDRRSSSSRRLHEPGGSNKPMSRTFPRRKAHVERATTRGPRADRQRDESTRSSGARAGPVRHWMTISHDLACYSSSPRSRLVLTARKRALTSGLMLRRAQAA
jgi:hypothetical protein